MFGASTFNVAKLVNREFFILITVAGVLFLPLAYWVMKGLLDSVYVYHVAITAGAFAGTLAVVLALALLTVGSQVYKIAVSNPVRTLRSE